MNVSSTTPSSSGPADAGALRPAGLPLVRVLVLVALMVVAAAVGEWMRPSYRLSEHKPPIQLSTQVPDRFGDWRIDKSITPVLPDPGLQAMLDSLYSQTLARTYINGAGERMMLSIAYGSDQGNEATAVHRPEFCYSAQGFRIEKVGSGESDIGGTRVPSAHLVARLGPRIEPITYWVTLDESATLPGIGRKLQQIRYGLRGQIPDGMLVRVSSIGADLPASFERQRVFLRQLYEAIPVAVRGRYFGTARAG